MSNRRRLRGAAATRSAERCSFCGHRIGRLDDALRLRTGQLACPRCRQHGELPRLPCGHIALPGTLILTDSDDHGTYQCPQCSPLAHLAGNLRLGMAPLKAG